MKPDWKSVHTELPIEDDAYLVAIHKRFLEVASFNAKTKEWVRTNENLTKYVTHWAELPETPNESRVD